MELLISQMCSSASCTESKLIYVSIILDPDYEGEMKRKGIGIDKDSAKNFELESAVFFGSGTRSIDGFDVPESYAIASVKKIEDNDGIEYTNN